VAADCERMKNGWQIRVENLDAEMLHTARTAGRKYEELEVNGTEHYLIFEAGQPCFEDGYHVINRVGDERYYAGRGDKRVFNTNTAEARTAENFVDDMSNHLDKVREERERNGVE